MVMECQECGVLLGAHKRALRFELSLFLMEIKSKFSRFISNFLIIYPETRLASNQTLEKQKPIPKGPKPEHAPKGSSPSPEKTKP